MYPYSSRSSEGLGTFVFLARGELIIRLAFFITLARVVEVGTTNDECVSCFGSARLFRVRIFLLFKMCVCLIGLQDPVPLASYAMWHILASRL